VANMTYCSIKSMLIIVLAGLSIVLFAGTAKIALDGPDTIDFGKYPGNEDKQGEFAIVNQGDGVLEIKRIRKPCGACVVTKLPKKTLAPQEKMIIVLGINGSEIRGNYQRRFFLESNDPKMRFLGLTLKGNAEPIILVKPKTILYGGRLTVGKAWEYAFTLEPYQRKAVELGKPIIQFNYPVKAEIRPDAGNYKLILSLTPDKAKGDLRGKLLLPILKPTGWKNIEIRVHAKIGMDFKAVPSKLFFTESPELVKKTFQLRLMGAANPINARFIRWKEYKGVDIKLGEANSNTISMTATFSSDFIKMLADGPGFPLKFTYPEAEDALIECRFCKAN